jgi:hypothetical protein
MFEMGPINPFMGYVAAGALVIGIAAGWKVKDWQCDAAYAKALEKAEKQRKELQGKIDDISTVYQIERDKADMVVAGQTSTVREIYKTLPAVPADCAVDARVLGLLESSISDTNSRASGKLGE